MRKALFWIIWLLEGIGFLISGGCVFLYIGYEGNIGLILLFLVCGAAMVFGLSKALISQRTDAEPSKLAYYLALPLIAAFIGYGSCFTFMN